MPAPYRANLILLAPYALSVLFVSDDTPLPITLQMVLGTGNYLAAPRRFYVLA